MYQKEKNAKLPGYDTPQKVIFLSYPMILNFDLITRVSLSH